ncbi:FAD:protein FMN transferase [hydrothermal vent metagenome]|uniref:FAD:protein FMN transferase n=1 Tax=hydrothermal vent metagenome TaxID=652676 RepID=A0A3B0ZT67_9ZZZZ
MSSLIKFKIVLLILVLSACSKTTPNNKLIKDSQFIFGTIVTIAFYGDNTMRTNQALKSIRQDFNALQKSWSPWDDRAMARVNKLIKTTKWFSYNPVVHTLLTDGKKYSFLSQELFNPTMGGLTKLWGFNTSDNMLSQPPAPSNIKKLLSNKTSMQDIRLKGVRMKSDNPNVVLDFGGMAKGLAVDLAITNLKKFNINNAIINAGGDIKVIGSHGDKPWHIGIRHPRGKNSILAGVDLNSNESIFTSGDYERYFISDGIRYHHILDPRTGYPATQTMSVTVIHSNAALADAAATALFVAGPQKWHEIAQAMAIKYVLLIDQKGNIYMNPAMQKRIRFQQKPNNIIISKPL